MVISSSGWAPFEMRKRFDDLDLRIQSFVVDSLGRALGEAGAGKPNQCLPAHTQAQRSLSQDLMMDTRPLSLPLLPLIALILLVCFQHHSLLSRLLQAVVSFYPDTLELPFCKEARRMFSGGTLFLSAPLTCKRRSSFMDSASGPCVAWLLLTFPASAQVPGTHQTLSCPGVLALGFLLPGTVFL